MIEFVNVSKQYRGGSWWGKKKTIQAVNQVSLQIKEGTCFALVGESGSGKSTLGKLLIGLEKPDEGHILFQGIDLHEAGPEQRQRLRRDMQIVFQDPYSAVNPRMKIKDVIAEPMRVHFQCSAAEMKEKVNRLLEAVGLGEDAGDKYAHQFSGGQLQRVTIARAISIRPKAIILDEVINSLDVLVQISIMKLLKKLQRDLNLTYLFICHDLHAVKLFADEVAVLEKGAVVDYTDDARSLDQLTHPASRRLIAAELPIVTPSKVVHERTEVEEPYAVMEGMYVS